MDNYDLTKSKVKYKPKDWTAYVRFFSTGLSNICSKDWNQKFPEFKISNYSGFELFMGRHYPTGFEPDGEIMRLGENYLFLTNAFIHRTDKNQDNGNIERCASSYTTFFVDKDELEHLTISEDDEARKIYKDNYFGAIARKEPILIPFSEEKRESKPKDIEFASNLFEICNEAKDFYECLREAKQRIDNFEGCPLCITSNNDRLSPEEKLQLACIFSNTEYDFMIGRADRNKATNHRVDFSKNDKQVYIQDFDNDRWNEHISLDIKDGFCTKDNINKVLKFINKTHEWMERYSKLKNAVESGDYSFFIERMKGKTRQEVIDGAKRAYEPLKPAFEKYDNLIKFEDKLKALANSLDQQQELGEQGEKTDSADKVSNEEEVIKIEQESPIEPNAEIENVQGIETEEPEEVEEIDEIEDVEELDDTEELPVYAIFTETVKVKNGSLSEEKTQVGKEIFLTKQGYINFENDYPGSLHVIPMTRESWINLISEKAHDFGRRIAIAEKASGKKLASKYRSIIPNNKYGKVDGTGIPGGLNEAIRMVLKLEDECKEFEEQVHEEILRR